MSEFPAVETKHPRFVLTGGALKCDCSLCIEGRIVDWAVEHGSRELLIHVIRRYQNLVACMGEDLEVHKAIMDGDWPSAAKQLECALERAKAKAELAGAARQTGRKA